MKYGDISNQHAPILAICVDDLLYNFHEHKGIFAKFLPKRKSINQNFVFRVNWIWSKTNFSIYLVSYKWGLSKLLENLTLGGVSSINCTQAISYLDGGIELARQDISYSYYLYIDTDEERLTKLSCPNTRHYSELESETGMDGRRFF